MFCEFTGLFKELIAEEEFWTHCYSVFTVIDKLKSGFVFKQQEFEPTVFYYFLSIERVLFW